MEVLSYTHQDHTLRSHISDQLQQLILQIVSEVQQQCCILLFIDWSVIIYTVLLHWSFTIGRYKSSKSRDRLLTVTSNIPCKKPYIVLLHCSCPLLIIFMWWCKGGFSWELRTSPVVYMKRREGFWYVLTSDTFLWCGHMQEIISHVELHHSLVWFLES